MTVDRHPGRTVFGTIYADVYENLGADRIQGDTYYVSKAGGDGLGGKSWGDSFLTITRALVVAGDNDAIVCGTGIYEEGATLDIDQDNLKLLGVMTSGHQWGQPSIHTHGTETLVKINSPNGQVELAGLGFHDQGAGVSIEVGTTANTWRNHIHHCYFGGNNTALWAVVMGNQNGSGVGQGSTIVAPSTIVEQCHFIYYVTGNVFMNAGYGSVVRDCVMMVAAGADGIRYFTNGASRPFAYILDNRFTTLDDTNAYGVKVTNTPTAGYLMVDGNRFNNFADNDHCISKRTGYTGLNYLGITAIAIT